METISIRDRLPSDNAWMSSFLNERWGGTLMVVNGETIDLLVSSALIAGNQLGLATYRLKLEDAELLSLDAAFPANGVGTALLTTVIARLRAREVRKLWVTTTNDNLSALKFYQRRGFRIVRLRPNAVDLARKVKSSIPLVGENGIPIRDELELCLNL